MLDACCRRSSEQHLKAPIHHTNPQGAPSASRNTSVATIDRPERPHGWVAGDDTPRHPEDPVYELALKNGKKNKTLVSSFHLDRFGFRKV